MERSPYIFGGITEFSVGHAEKRDPRFAEITKLNLEIGSKIPPGKYPLVLVKPFPPLGRAGKERDRLAALHAEDIDSIWVFPKPNNGQWARIEVQGRDPGATIFIRCERIEGVPGWDEKQQTDSNRASDRGK